MLELIGIFSVLCFSKLMKKKHLNMATFKIPALHLIKKYIYILNAFIRLVFGPPCNYKNDIQDNDKRQNFTNSPNTFLILHTAFCSHYQYMRRLISRKR